MVAEAVALIDFVPLLVVAVDGVLADFGVMLAVAVEVLVEVEDVVVAAVLDAVVTFFGGSELRLAAASATEVLDLLRSGRSGGALLSASLDELLSLL